MATQTEPVSPVAAVRHIHSEGPSFGCPTSDPHHPELAQFDQGEHTGVRDVVDAEGYEGERP